MKAIKHKIIIEPINYKELPSGLVISVKELENPTGIVVSAGGGTAKNPMIVQDGDKVTYLHNVGQNMEYEGKNYLVLHETHIIGIE